MDTTTAPEPTIVQHMHLTRVLDGARMLLAAMGHRDAHYLPREVFAQERRVAMLEAKLDSIECPER